MGVAAGLGVGHCEDVGGQVRADEDRLAIANTKEIAGVGRSGNVGLVDFNGRRIGKTKLGERGSEGC